MDLINSKKLNKLSSNVEMVFHLQLTQMLDLDICNQKRI